MARIFKRGKVWYLDIRVKGRRVRRRVGASKKIAELALKDAEVKVAKDEFGLTSNDIPVDRLIRKFREYSRANHAPGTLMRYSSALDNFQSYLGAKYPNVISLSQITHEVIDCYKTHRKDNLVDPNGQEVQEVHEYTRRGARSHTVNFELKLLNNLFNLAIRWDHLKDNPTKGVTRLKVNDAKRVRFLTAEECQRLLEASPPEFYPIYFTYLSTGMRKLELINLEWEDVDFERRKIMIRHKESWHPKTGEREIPISGQLYDVLSKLKARNDTGLRSDFVFPHPDGGKIRTKLRGKLIQIAKQAGIPDLTKIHTLRHTFASHLVMSGVDLPTVKKLMGHSDIQTTMIYAHLAPDHLAEAVDRLSFQ